MIEYQQTEGAIPTDSELGVKVIGVGGAGANVLDRMALEGSDDAELLTLNTDMRALSTSVSGDKIQLGSALLKGMGTGGDPSLGKQAALEAVDEIREAVREQAIVFLCVGLGGGTGSGAAPEVCRIAREEGAFLVVFATMPFSFEGERRGEQAKAALARISNYANAVITFDNDRMGELIVPKDGVTQAFAAADKIISQSIRATMNVVFRPGIIRIGMDDLLSALEANDSRCLFGYGLAKGDNRSHEAVEQALKCPLLDRGRLLSDASAVLVQVAGGDSMTLYEVQLVMEEVSKHVGSDTQILFGTGTDKRLGTSLSVTIISSISGPGGEIAPVENAVEDSPVSLTSMADTIPVSPLASAAAVPQEEKADDLVAEKEVVSTAELDASEAEEEEFALKADDLKLAGEIEQEEEDSAIYEPLDDMLTDPIREEEEVPAMVLDEVEKEEEVNPIAKALETPKAEKSDDVAPIRPMTPKPDEAGEGEKIEAVTESEQKISLTRMVSSGKTGRIKTRPPQSEDEKGAILPPATKAPALPAESLEPDPSDEAKQQQEMLQLEPVSGKGRFAKSDPTIVDGEDLDVPTFLRKKK
ncbi:MAG: cell division protein FtsZ [Verrucomicrobiota bacterium]